MSDFITIITAEGTEIPIEKKFSELSSTIMSSIEENPGEPIKFENISEVHLNKVLDFLKHNETTPLATLPKPLRSNKIIENGVDEYYANFV